MSTKFVEFTYPVPDGVRIRYEGGNIVVEGKKGRIIKDLSHIPAEITVDNGKVRVKVYGRNRKAKAMIGTIQAVIENAVTGVTTGFRYTMKIVSSHFPISVKVSGKEVLIMNFIGERFARKAAIVGDTKVEVKQDEVIITGVDKEAVGQTAANIEKATKIRSKDPRKFLDGIYIYQKEVGS